MRDCNGAGCRQSDWRRRGTAWAPSQLTAQRSPMPAGDDAVWKPAVSAPGGLVSHALLISWEEHSVVIVSDLGERGVRGLGDEGERRAPIVCQRCHRHVDAGGVLEEIAGKCVRGVAKVKAPRHTAPLDIQRVDDGGQNSQRPPSKRCRDYANTGPTGSRSPGRRVRRRGRHFGGAAHRPQHIPPS